MHGIRDADEEQKATEAGQKVDPPRHRFDGVATDNGGWEERDERHGFAGLVAAATDLQQGLEDEKVVFVVDDAICAAGNEWTCDYYRMIIV